jgi:hypothetical protein
VRHIRSCFSASLLTFEVIVKTLIRYAIASIIIQGVFWVVFGVLGILSAPSPMMDFLLEKLAYLYYPTIVIVARLGDFKGDANIIRPILLGVPLGIFVYSIAFGFFVMIIQEWRNP